VKNEQYGEMLPKLEGCRCFQFYQKGMW